eukprot:9499853-Pyramimonas_sp.AAC.1
MLACPFLPSVCCRRLTIVVGQGPSLLKAAIQLLALHLNARVRMLDHIRRVTGLILHNCRLRCCRVENPSHLVCVLFGREMVALRTAVFTSSRQVFAVHGVCFLSAKSSGVPARTVAMARTAKRDSSGGGGGGGGKAPRKQQAEKKDSGARGSGDRTNCGRCAAVLEQSDVVLCGSRCKKLWVVAYSYMTEDEFADQYKGSLEFQHSVDLAERVFEKKLDRAFYPSSIQREDAVEMVAVGRFRGYTSQDFKEEFKMTISEAGFKVREVPAADGSTYKGVLVNIGDTKNRDVELRVSKGFTLQEHLLQSSNCVHPDEGHQSFEAIKDKDKNHKDLVTMALNAPSLEDSGINSRFVVLLTLVFLRGSVLKTFRFSYC